MVRPPKHIPGERNPAPDADAPIHVARESYMGGQDFGIARAVIAVLDWRMRRRAMGSEWCTNVACSSNDLHGLHRIGVTRYRCDVCGSVLIAPTGSVFAHRRTH